MDQLQLQRDANKLLDKMGLAPPREPGDPLRANEVLAIVRLHHEGKTQTEIAALVGCDQSTVSRHLAELQKDTSDATRQLYQSQQLRVVSAVLSRVEDEDVRVALKAAELAHRGGEIPRG